MRLASCAKVQGLEFNDYTQDPQRERAGFSCAAGRCSRSPMRLASCANVGRSAGSLAMHSLASATTAAFALGSQARLSSLMATAYTICAA